MRNFLQRHFRLSLYFLFSTLVLYACSRSIDFEELFVSTETRLSDPSVPLNTKLAQQYFNRLVKKEGDLDKKMNIYNQLLESKTPLLLMKNGSTKKESEIVKRKLPYFRVASTFQNKSNSYVEVPLFYNQRSSLVIVKNNGQPRNIAIEEEIFRATFDRLIIFKNKRNGKINQFIVTFIPDIDYLRKNDNDISHNKFGKLDKDFNGYLEYKRWDGTRLYFRRIENGKAVKKVRLLDRVKNEKQLKTTSTTGGIMPMGLQCDYYYSPVYGEICLYEDPEDENTLICEEVVMYYEEFEDCWDDGLTGDDCIDYGIDCPCYDCGPDEGGDPYEPDPEPETPKPKDKPKDSLIRDFCNNLNAAQKELLENAASAMKTFSCASSYIYNTFEVAGIKFGFCIGPGSQNATYNSATKTFNFQTDYSATRKDIMEHELIHAYQDHIYPGGTSGYSKIPSPTDPDVLIAQPGLINIEFEQALIGDILHNTQITFGSWGNLEQRERFDLWIDSITNDRTEYPKLYPNGTPSQVAEYSNFILKYNSFLAEYNNLEYNSYSSNILNLLPHALINIFNNINPNCP